MTTLSVKNQEAINAALPEVIFKLKVEVEHGECSTILSSVIQFLVCFVSFHYVCR